MNIFPFGFLVYTLPRGRDIWSVEKSDRSGLFFLSRVLNEMRLYFMDCFEFNFFFIEIIIITLKFIEIKYHNVNQILSLWIGECVLFERIE
jgi:hypothetical protein